MSKSSLKSTLAVSLNNYLDAGAIVAGGSGITLWQSYLGLSEMHLGEPEITLPKRYATSSGNNSPGIKIVVERHREGALERRF